MTIKIALVTGGSRGLCNDMALSLAKKGIDVILTYNTKKAEAEKVVSQIERSGRKAVALKFDVSDIKSFDNLMNIHFKGGCGSIHKVCRKRIWPACIRANVVAPGAIETDFNNAVIRNNPQMKSFVASQTALGRVGNADDIGSVVAFLCTE